MMRLSSMTVLFVAVLCIGIAGIALADTPALKPLVVNASGTYLDKGVWLYRNADGKYVVGQAVGGTNERLIMPSPSPSPGGALAGVEIIRHPLDTLGYPLHIALVEKLFAASFQTMIEATNDGDLWRYDFGEPVTSEKPITGGSRPSFKDWGPFHADAVPIAQAPEPNIQAAFNFAKTSLNSIGNMPKSQKNLANYGVLFVDDGNTIWVELGPRFGPDEAPHLGCQTQLGRDMVFGYTKRQSDSGAKAGKFLQCF
jgi:hypothetical protein